MPIRPFPCPDQAAARRCPLLMTAWQMEHDAWQTGGRSQGLCHLPFLICHAGPGPDRRRPSLVRSADAASRLGLAWCASSGTADSWRVGLWIPFGRSSKIAKILKIPHWLCSAQPGKSC